MVIRKYKMESIAKKCVELVYDLSYKANGEITCFHRNNRIIILIGQSSEKPSISVNDSKIFAKELHDIFTKKVKDTTFLIGIGQQYSKINSLHKSFSEANEVIRLMQQINEKNEISHFEDYSVYHLLDSNIKVSALEVFFEKSLGKIFEHDKVHGTGYITTLENYFSNNLNVSETAKAMFLHRNTLIYRIDKIKEILNTDLKDSEELLRIQIALKIFRILFKGFI
jgi:purine catabolism regulator